MKRTISEPNFQSLVSSALTDCEANDVGEKLTGVDLDPEVIEATVAFERKRRIGIYTTAIYSALDAHVPALAQQKAELDRELELAEFMLGKKAPEATEEYIPTELDDDLLEKLATGVVDKDTFVDIAHAYGHPKQLASRAFYKLKRNDLFLGNNSIDISKLFVTLFEEDDEHDRHPLIIRHHGFGPSMLDVAFAIGDAYLTALERQQANE